MFRLLVSLFLCALFATAVSASSVRATKGNIYYFGDGGVARQLTSFGADSEPSLSPDGGTIVFVRVKSITLDGPDREAATELWAIDISGSNPRLLLKPRPAKKPEEDLSGFSNPLFSLDGGSVYFISSAWATSGAIHILNLRTKKTRFVSAGNSMQLVPSGKYVGNLIIAKHKYFAGTGTYNFYWLVSPQGKEIMPVGEQHEQIAEFLRTNE